MEGIKKARKKAMLTQSELAERIEVTQQTIHAWETGKIQVISSNLIKLSKVLECSIDDLVKGE
jgi:DNA-binding XRE family transcriptional regulator